MPIIREARLEERPSIVSMLIRAYGEFQSRLAPAGWETMRRSIADTILDPDAGVPLIAEVNGRIAASVLYTPPHPSDGALIPGEWASIRLLGVDPAMRGLGLAHGLVEACLARADEDGAERVGLYTSELMQRARALYERMEFQLVREIEPRHGLRYWLFVREGGGRGGTEGGE